MHRWKLIYAFITLASSLVLWSVERIAEHVYGALLYPIIRSVYDYSLGNLPFCSVYLILPAMITYLAYPYFMNMERRSRGREVLWRIFFVLTIFYWSWGFNYARPNVKELLNLEIPEVNTADLYCLFEEVCSASRDIRNIALSEPSTGKSLEETCRGAVGRFLDQRNMDSPGRPRVRLLSPSGILLGISTAGIYFPYAFEAHIDAGLHDISQPITMAHELSHGYGITDEGECNFLGAVACLESGNPQLTYSAYVQMIRWLFYPLVLSGEDPDFLRSLIPEAVRSDIKDIREKHDAYPQYFPEAWRNAIYGSYLKAQGVNSGLQSYGEVVGMLMAYHMRKEGGLL